MNFWTAFALFIVASALIYGALSVNGKTEAPAGDAHGHDDHGHGHDDHGHGGHGH
jgi:hypothetical protein